MIILLNGSPRKNGTTSTILKYIEQLLQQKQIETKLIHVSDLKLKYCDGCSKCYQIGKCIYNDDIEHLSIEIRNCSCLIMATPTYASNISAQLKTIIDKGHFVIEQLLDNKQAMSIVTYENYGGTDTLKILNKLLLFSGANICGKIKIKNSFPSNPLNNKNINIITKQTNKFYYALINNKKSLIQTIIKTIIFNFGIVPFVKKKGNKYIGVTNIWKKNHIKAK